jgi:hypothetical protein
MLAPMLMSAARRVSRNGWAKLIARVYETDPLQCSHCGGRMKCIAFVVPLTQCEGGHAEICGETRLLANGE